MTGTARPDVERLAVLDRRYVAHSHDEFVISANGADPIRERIRLDRRRFDVGTGEVTIYNPGEVRASKPEVNGTRMQITPIRRSATAVVLALCLALAGGCTPDDPTPSGVESASATAAPTSGAEVRAASWAREISTGAAMWSTSRDGWTITGYDMGADVAPQDSHFSDPERGQPVVRKGDPIAFVNVVATNTGDKTLYISIDEPDLWAMPIGSGYTQGVVGMAPASDQQARDHGIWYHNYSDESDLSYPYPVEPGESCALGGVLPLNLGLDFVFVPQLRAHDDPADMLGHRIEFDQQTYTFPY